MSRAKVMPLMNKKLILQIDQKLLERLDWYAKNHQIGRAAAVRELIRKGLLTEVSVKS